MKIKLPEKRYFSISELSKRWECENSDVIHLLEVGELPSAEKLAARHGKRSIFFGYFGYQIDLETPCFLPKASEKDSEYWNEVARDDQAILVVPVACDFPVEGNCHSKVYMLFEKQLAEWKQKVPEDFEPVILLQDVLKLEARYLAEEGTEKPLSATERNTLLTIIAALCDYSAIKYQERGAAIQIAKLTEEIGATVSDDAVRRVLAKIPDALEARMK